MGDQPGRAKRALAALQVWHPRPARVPGGRGAPRGLPRDGARPGQDGSPHYSARRARLGKRCRFASRVTFHRASRLGRGRLKFVVRFSGNRAVAPGPARTLRVRAR